jgi:hypothetical protein
MGAERWNASNIQERLDKGNDPWSDYEASRQSILPAMKILGFKPLKEAPSTRVRMPLAAMIEPAFCGDCGSGKRTRNVILS